MYQNLANQNPILSQFNGYMMQNQNNVPFFGNQLINQNPHVMHNLNTFIHSQKTNQANIMNYSQTNISSKSKNKKSNSNIIEEMLKPQKIIKDNKDVSSNFRNRKDVQKQAKKGNIGIIMTNAPYKNIIKDKIITKDVDKVKLEDLLVHKVDKKIDADVEIFNKELDTKEKEKENINKELEIEFHIDNYDKHKGKFEYKQTFIKNMAFEQNTYIETKQDFIEFYRQKQKEAEEGQKLCDELLHNMVDDGVISKDELPTLSPSDSEERKTSEILITNEISKIPKTSKTSKIPKKPSSKTKRTIRSSKNMRTIK